MIPDTVIPTDLTIIDNIEPSRAYKLSDVKIQGFTDNLEALKQAIYKVLNTEKYEYPIYSFSYGIELENLLGKDATYVKIELKRRIRECLLQDDRIRDVGNFNFRVNGDLLVCIFDVHSIFGEFSVTKEVVI